MAHPTGKFVIDPDIFLCNYQSRCIFSCNGYIEILENRSVTVTATDVNAPLLTGTDWKLESAECIIDDTWKIRLSRGSDTVDTLAWENRPEGEGFKKY